MARCNKAGCNTDHKAGSGVLAAHNREARTSTGKPAVGNGAARYGTPSAAQVEEPPALTAAEKYPRPEPGVTSASKDPNGARERSYRVRLKQSAWMVLREPAMISRQEVEDGQYERLMIPAGTRVWADRDSNAGFRGIETVVRLTNDRANPDRAWWQTVSTGILDNDK